MAAPTCATSLAGARAGRGAPSSEACKRRRDRERWQRRGRARNGRSRSRSSAALQHRLGQLLDEQRHAVRALDDLHPRPPAAAPCRRRPARPAPHPVARLKPAERSIVTCGCPIHGGWNSGRKVTTSSTGRLADPLDDPVQQLAARSGRSSARPRRSSAPAAAVPDPRAARASAASVFSLRFCGLKVERRIASDRSAATAARPGALRPRADVRCRRASSASSFSSLPRACRRARSRRRVRAG